MSSWPAVRAIYHELGDDEGFDESELERELEEEEDDDTLEGEEDEEDIEEDDRPRRPAPGEFEEEEDDDRDEFDEDDDEEERDEFYEDDDEDEEDDYDLRAGGPAFLGGVVVSNVGRSLRRQTASARVQPKKASVKARRVAKSRQQRQAPPKAAKPAARVTPARTVGQPAPPPRRTGLFAQVQLQLQLNDTRRRLGEAERALSPTEAKRYARRLAAVKAGSMTAVQHLASATPTELDIITLRNDVKTLSAELATAKALRRHEAHPARQPAVSRLYH